MADFARVLATVAHVTGWLTQATYKATAVGADGADGFEMTPAQILEAVAYTGQQIPVDSWRARVWLDSTRGSELLISSPC
jgi:hypothetical protein